MTEQATQSPGQQGVQYLTVPPTADGQRLDNFLFSRLKGVPRSRIYRLIRKGEIRVNKKRCRPEQRLLSTDQIRVAPIRTATREAPPTISDSLRQTLQAAILYQDEHLLVINKPAGLAVHAGTGVHLGLIEALRQLWPDQDFLELVHRLDRETSGCLLVARSPYALHQLQTALKKRQVDKHYHALVQGNWPETLLEVNAPLQRDELRGGERVVVVSREGKPALTRFRVLQRLRDATLIEAMPVSGRTHQIRVHCRHAGHSILGDDKYLDTADNRFPGIRHLCLHAAAIRFDFTDEHGQTHQKHFSAALPTRMTDYLQKLA